MGGKARNSSVVHTRRVRTLFDWAGKENQQPTTTNQPTNQPTNQHKTAQPPTSQPANQPQQASHHANDDDDDDDLDHTTTATTATNRRYPTVPPTNDAVPVWTTQDGFSFPRMPIVHLERTQITGSRSIARLMIDLRRLTGGLTDCVTFSSSYVVWEVCFCCCCCCCCHCFPCHFDKDVTRNKQD